MGTNKKNSREVIQTTCVINYKGILVIIEPSGELKKYRAKGLRYYRRDEIEWLVKKGLLDRKVISDITEVPSNYEVYSDITGKRISVTPDKETQHMLKEYRLIKYNTIMWKA